MSYPEISWKLPWYPMQSQPELLNVQHELELEIIKNHPLWGKDAVIIGRRIDQDDVLVKLNDGKYVKVHLFWKGSPDPLLTKYPRTVIFESLDEFISIMSKHALMYDNDET